MHLIYRNAFGTWEAHMNLCTDTFLLKKKKKEKIENSASDLTWGENKNKI